MHEARLYKKLSTPKGLDPYMTCQACWWKWRTGVGI